MVSLTELQYLMRSLLQKTRGGEATLSSPPSQKASVHSWCVPEVNRRCSTRPIPVYTGLTSQSTLKDSGRQKRGLQGTCLFACYYNVMYNIIAYVLQIVMDPEVTVADLEKRLERLETEKLELVKV